MNAITQRWALVAGGSGGIGAAVCRALATDGWNVALTYHRNADAAVKVAREIEERGRSAVVTRLDLTDAAATAEVVRSVADRDELAGVVYAAGPFIPMRYIEALPPEVFREQMLNDAVACYNLLQPALTRLRESRGALVAVVTPALQRYAKKDLMSLAPKAAVQAVVRGIAAEEGRNGVRANCVGAGLIEGDGLWNALRESGTYTDELLTAAKRSIAMRRFGSVDDVAEAVSFLLSHRAGWITGQTLMVDGGYSV